MLLIGLFRRFGDIFASTDILYPVHFSCEVGLERTMVYFTQSLPQKRTDYESEDKVRDQTLDDVRLGFNRRKT